MRRNTAFQILKLLEKPDFTAFAVSGSFLHANSLDLVKIPLHSFCLPIPYMFVTFENAVFCKCAHASDIIYASRNF